MLRGWTRRQTLLASTLALLTVSSLLVAIPASETENPVLYGMQRHFRSDAQADEVLAVESKTGPTSSTELERLLDEMNIAVTGQVGEVTDQVSQVLTREQDNQDSAQTSAWQRPEARESLEGSTWAYVTSAAAGMGLLGLILKVSGVTLLARGGDTRRETILEMVRQEPGLRLKEIMEATDLKNGVTRYHLDCLEKKILVRRVVEGRSVRYFPTKNTFDL